MDRGSFHRTRQLDWPDNLIPIFQPANSPELNPIERLWEYLKAQIRWENFPSLKELCQHLTHLLEQLTPEVITSLTGWEMITTAVLSASS
jgi:transposase